MDQADVPSLITGVQVKGATAADNAFYEEAIAKSGETTGTKVDTVFSDGAYQSADNRALAVNGVFTGIQGRRRHPFGPKRLLFRHVYIFLFLLTGRYPQMGVDGLKY